MSKVLIAISSCQSYEDSGANQAQRDTWLRDLSKGWDYRFFHGGNSKPGDDVVLVNCHDEYYDLTSKTKEKLRWALVQEYDFVFACFPDTYVRPERLEKCGFDKYDYFGDIYCHFGGRPYCQGGAGYFLSRRACELIVSNSENYPNEDTYVGNVLNSVGVSVGDCKDFHQSGEGPLKRNTTISSHLSNREGGFNPSTMIQEHQNWLHSLEER